MTNSLNQEYVGLINHIISNPLQSSSEIFNHAGDQVSYATMKRMLQFLVKEGWVITEGRGKATRYNISPGYRMLYPINPDVYFQKEIDERTIFHQFNFSIFETLGQVDIFNSSEQEKLNKLQLIYRDKVERLSQSELKKDLERLAIDLSWKSSQIEGNTYSLLETERLLKEQKTAAGKTRDEATMLINHKTAIDFLMDHPDYIEPFQVSVIEDVHALLIKDLEINRNIRNRNIAITGTKYRPLDNEFQIREALEQLCLLTNRQQNIFARALLTLLLISYIQPFTDGNKRTARILCNSLLMNKGYCPLSFRTIDPIDYKKAILIFYEQNNISAFKNIFIDQYEFAVTTYF
jgi:Fic family protein